MSATYTFDVFSTLDGYGAHSGNWGGYWSTSSPGSRRSPGFRCARTAACR